MYIMLLPTHTYVIGRFTQKSKITDIMVDLSALK